MGRHQAVPAEQIARRSARKRSARAQWHLLGDAFRRTMARSADLLWPTHHLLQPFRSVNIGDIARTPSCGVRWYQTSAMSDRAVTNLIGRILVCQSLRTEIAAGRQFAEPKAQSSLIAPACNSRLRGASRCTSGRRGLFWRRGRSPVRKNVERVFPQ
jgi:hypothetical protein